MISKLIIHASSPAMRKRLLSTFHKFEADNQAMINEHGHLLDGIYQMKDPAEAEIEIQGQIAAIQEIGQDEEE